MKSILGETASSLIQLNAPNNTEGDVKYSMVGKFGVDGSGSHKVRQQLIDKS